MYLPLEKKGVPEASGLKGLEAKGEIHPGWELWAGASFPGMAFPDVSTSGAHQGGTWSTRIATAHPTGAVRS